MANQGIIEKVGVARPGAKGLLGCIRLVERDKEDHSEALGLKGDGELYYRTAYWHDHVNQADLFHVQTRKICKGRTSLSRSQLKDKC